MYNFTNVNNHDLPILPSFRTVWPSESSGEEINDVIRNVATQCFHSERAPLTGVKGLLANLQVAPINSCTNFSNPGIKQNPYIDLCFESEEETPDAYEVLEELENKIFSKLKSEDWHPQELNAFLEGSNGTAANQGHNAGFSISKSRSDSQELKDLINKGLEQYKILFKDFQPKAGEKANWQSLEDQWIVFSDTLKMPIKEVRALLHHRSEEVIRERIAILCQWHDDQKIDLPVNLRGPSNIPGASQFRYTPYDRNKSKSFQ